MKTALRAGDPVLMLETKALFASKGPVPQGEHLVPFGVARIAREGTDLTIATAGQLVHRALEAAETLEGEGISCEVIDLRTIQPLDVETVAESVRKTHRLLVVDEAYSLFGVGAELGQAMHELRLRRSRRAGRAAAHAAHVASLRAGAGARHAGRRGRRSRRRRGTCWRASPRRPSA